MHVGHEKLHIGDACHRLGDPICAVRRYNPSLSEHLYKQLVVWELQSKNSLDAPVLSCLHEFN
jgi:hypothetical protein